jgi:hypothetical protein
VSRQSRNARSTSDILTYELIRSRRQRAIPSAVSPSPASNTIRLHACEWRLDRNPLDLVERDLIAGAIIELGGAGTFVRGHILVADGGSKEFEEVAHRGVAPRTELQGEKSHLEALRRTARRPQIACRPTFDVSSARREARSDTRPLYVGDHLIARFTSATVGRGLERNGVLNVKPVRLRSFAQSLSRYKGTGRPD